MNIDEHPQIAGQLGIQSIPAVIAFDRGQPVDGFVGALPESQIRGFIERLIGPLKGGTAELLAEAEEAAAKGDAAGAASIYAEILAETPEDVKAIGGPRQAPRRRRQCRRGEGAARDRSGARARQGARSGDRRRSRRGEPRRAGLQRRRARAARGGGRRRPERPSGAVRPRASRFRPRASGTRRPIICSRSSAATANGTTRRRASSCCSSSRPGV